jgi:Flp pilus assembly protein TadB
MFDSLYFFIMLVLAFGVIIILNLPHLILRFKTKKNKLNGYEHTFIGH